MRAPATVNFYDGEQGIGGVLMECFPELGLVVVRTSMPDGDGASPGTMDRVADILADSSYFLVPWLGEGEDADFADRHIPLMVPEDGPARAVIALKRWRMRTASSGRPPVPPNRVRKALGDSPWDDPPGDWTPPDGGGPASVP